MKQPLRFFSAVMILLTMFACVLPAQSTASLPTVTPDTRLDIMLAETVSAALEMTQQAAPTRTPLPTRTPIPTVTTTPEPVLSGSTLIKNDDETFAFVDTNGKYQITLPSELLAMRVGEQEFLDAWLLPAASNSAIQNQLSSIQDQDPQRFRLFAIDFDESHIEGGFVTNIYLLWDDAANLSTEESLIQTANDYLKAFPGAEIVESKAAVLQSGTPVGLVTFKNKVTTLENVEITVIQKQAFLTLPQGILVITLATAESQLEFVEPLFDEMLESFGFIDEDTVN